MATLTQAVAKNAAYQTIGKMLSVVLGAVSFGLMARYLGRDGFGEYTTITTFSIFFSTMADMGFYFIAVREISKENGDDERIFGNAFTLRLLATVVFLGIAPLLALFVFHYSGAVRVGILIASFSTFFISINQILVAIFQKHLRTDRVALAEVVSRALLVGATVLLIRGNFGLLSFVWALGVSSFLNFAVLYFFSRRFLKFRLHFDFAVWKSILKESWPIGLVIMMNLFYYRFDAIQLSLMKPAEDVGIYGAAYKIIDILISLPSIFVGLIIPVLSRSFAADRAKFAEVFRRAFNALILGAVPIAVGTQFVAPWIIALVGGEKFAPSAPVLKLLIIAVLGMFISNLAINTIIVIRKQRSTIWISLYAAVSSVVLNFLLIPGLSYMGAALTTVITEFSIATLTFILVYRSVGLKPDFLVLAKALLSGAIMGGVLYLAHFEAVLLNVGVGAVVYVVSLLVFGALKKSDITQLVNLSGKKDA